MTRTPLSGSKVKVTRPVYSPRRLRPGSCSGQRGNVLSVRNCCYVAICRLGGARRYGAHRGGEGRGISCRHAHSLFSAQQPAHSCAYGREVAFELQSNGRRTAVESQSNLSCNHRLTIQNDRWTKGITVGVFCPSVCLSLCTSMSFLEITKKDGIYCGTQDDFEISQASRSRS